MHDGDLEHCLFFSIQVLFHEHSQIAGLQGKGEGIPLPPHYHFHPLHRPLDNSHAITAESSPLHLASSRTRTENLWFSRASRLTTKLRKKKIDVHMIFFSLLYSGIPEQALGILKMLIRVFFRDLLQPAVYWFVPGIMRLPASLYRKCTVFTVSFCSL